MLRITWANLGKAVTLIAIVGAVLGVIYFIIYVETNRQIGQLYKNKVMGKIKNQVKNGKWKTEKPKASEAEGEVEVARHEAI